jgi:hypothetical protein
MRNQNCQNLNVWRKLTLAGAGIAAVAIPVITGMVNASPIRMQGPQNQNQIRGHTEMGGGLDPPLWAEFRR